MMKKLSGIAAVACVIALAPGCSAVYPEIGTRLSAFREGQKLDPPPPKSLRFLRFTSARVPPKTRDGREWHSAFGKLPDPYAKLFVNNAEIIRTPVQAETLEPTWPNGPHGNFKVGLDDKVRIELWDANPINDQPIGISELGRITEEQLSSRTIRTTLDGNAEVTLAIEPAHAMNGVGLWFEIRTNSVFVTRLIAESPAERAGIGPGDEVVMLAGRPVKQLSPDEVRSYFNAVPIDGLAIGLKKPAGTRLDAKVKEGPIYPPFDQFGSVD